MAKNCWEFKGCGREPRGKNVASMGVCPAATDTTADRINGGRMGGRICWSVGGTFCGGKVQGTFAEKQASCLNCEFFQQVKLAQGASSSYCDRDRTTGKRRAEQDSGLLWAGAVVGRTTTPSSGSLPPLRGLSEGSVLPTNHPRFVGALVTVRASAHSWARQAY